MKYNNINAIISATCTTLFLIPIKATSSKQSYSGPGRIECYDGACNFTVDASVGCSDPCHTHTYSNPFEYSFADVAQVRGKIRHYPSQNLCYYKEAKSIYTDDWYHWGLKIDEGCLAACTGCTFYPTEIFSGPGLLQCFEGNCYSYADRAPYNDCGMQIQNVSEEWGEISVLGSGSDDVKVFSGFNNITTEKSIAISEDCSLDCSGCQFTRSRSSQLGMKGRAETNG